MKNNFILSDIESIRKDCFTTMLGMYYKSNAGHIGSSLSCLEILIYLYFIQMKPQDKFILSKGHSAAALYTVLEKSGKIKKEHLESFYIDGTSLAAHPPCNGRINEIIFGTGSLGHGLSLACGLALATKYTKKDYRVYAVLSEGDCNEGSTWEAALFASQHMLGNLIAIIDSNGLQGFGHSKDVLNLEPLAEKWKAFNFDVYIVNNGNNFSSLNNVFAEINFSDSRPKCIIATTIKGHSVSYMENKMEWHYLPMSEEQYVSALNENM